MYLFMLSYGLSIRIKLKVKNILKCNIFLCKQNTQKQNKWDACGLKSIAACTITKLIFFLKLKDAGFNQVCSVVWNLQYVEMLVF